jgi:uncharacterized protein YjiS (DUF1127 family)
MEVPMTRISAPLAPISWLAVAGRAVSGAFQSVASLATALRHRREIRSLADLDDRALKDIGLIRSDVSGALAEPFYRNPSTVLVRSMERDRRVRRTFAERTIRPIVPMVKDENLS